MAVERAHDAAQATLPAEAAQTGAFHTLLQPASRQAKGPT
jgi:hypothetical protein